MVARASGEAFLRTAAELLHRWGTPTDRIEDGLMDCARGLGLRLQVLATPTAVSLAFGGRRQRTVLIRGESGETELARLVAIDRILAAVGERRLDPVEGRERLLALARQPSPHGPIATLLAHALLAGSAAAFLDGSVADVLASALLGLAIGGFGRAAAGRPIARLFAPIATFVAALISQGLARLVPGIAEAVVGLAGVIVLLPGLSLTLAMSELATRHLVSGTARLAGALMVFLTMAFGVALAHRLLAFGSLPIVLELGPSWTTPLPAIARPIGLLLAPLGACVLFQARWRDLPAVTIAGVAGAVASAITGPAFGPELAAFVGAIVVGLASNAYARWFALPSSVVLLPGLLMLVPGSIGFRSVTAFLAGEPMAGIDAAFRMTLVAVALVAGVLAANSLLPASRVATTPR
ncbi:threonine/serine ThrE exporter family protein [Nannocystaceae bacterium ST9]